MKNYLLSFTYLFIVFFLTTGCAQKSVTRVSSDQDIDLSGRWNDADSRRVAESLAGSVLNSPWLNNFRDNHNRRPVIIVGLVKNKSHEHIASQTFIKDIEKEFIQSQRIRVVQNDVFREKLREERADQQEFASPDTQKRWGAELGADFMMFGTISSIVDSEGKRQVNFYQVDLELTNLETNELVWLDGKKIKKYIVN